MVSDLSCGISGIGVVVRSIILCRDSYRLSWDSFRLSWDSYGLSWDSRGRFWFTQRLEANRSFSLNRIDEFSNSDLTILVGIEPGNPGLGLVDINNINASVVVALDVSPKLLGLRVV
jgi:hypothetical protein